MNIITTITNVLPVIRGFRSLKFLMTGKETSWKVYLENFIQRENELMKEIIEH